MPRTHRFARLWFGVAFALIAAVVPLGGAGANHNTPATKYTSLPNTTVTPLSSPTASWTGTTATGTNANYSFTTGEPCHHPNPTVDPDPQKCDIMLLHVDLSEAPNYWDTFGGGVEISIGNYTVPSSDFDLQCYRADATGLKLPGGPLCQSGALAGQPERATLSEPSGYYLIQVVYFAVTNGSYTGNIRFVPRPAIPPDTDNPPGLQEVLASDPSQGWTSRSEMHIAQNPVNPNMLVAGSKFYNKDPQALAEYEFKVGSYVSFDRGRSWIDLGQVRTCPMAQSPPEVWFTAAHTCYPEDVPTADNEFGEQYITSDPWVQWDDEGNAYYMLLDSPPFANDQGWGMTMHRWDSVSLADVSSGNTWGPRLPISEYSSDLEQELFLDDKNTFAVQNAGPNGDGTTGNIVACWGKNVPAAVKQAEVCKVSLDKGETWTPEQPINDVEQLGIGVGVVADKFDPLTFYAAYLQYVTTLPGEGAPATIEFNKSVDGGLTWLPASITVAAIDSIPTQFPGQTFRNLSIPIIAAGNRLGSTPLSEVYITWAEERVTAEAGGQKETEIALVRSDDGGTTWGGLGAWNPGQVGSPHIKVVNGPDSGRSQFQPYVDVTPLGQVNVLYFDRRHDPSNYYVDTFLSRSNNRGATFTDHRLSHDATDPEYNAPTDSAGNKFFGDYQGLVVDNCFAYPFVNDTHLANDAFLDPGPGPRDPDFDFTMPDSPYQEAISWRVPNNAAFGGIAQPGCTISSRRRSIPG